MRATVPVFVNERRCQVPPGSSAAEAVGYADPALASALAEGRAYLTDASGLRVDPGSPVTAGAILRVVVTARPSSSG